MPGLGLLTLRLTVGIGFVAHGLPKLIPVWGGNPRAAAATLESAGVGWPYLVAVGTGLAETLGGLLLLAGAYTPLGVTGARRSDRRHRCSSVSPSRVFSQLEPRPRLRPRLRVSFASCRHVGLSDAGRPGEALVRRAKEEGFTA